METYAETMDFFKTGSQGINTDSRLRLIQRGLSKDGCSSRAYVMSEIQQLLEPAGALSTTEEVTGNTIVVVKADIAQLFPLIDCQIIFDMHAGIAPRDYPNTAYKRGDRMPASAIFKAMLPLCKTLYGSATPMHSYHGGRKVQPVDFFSSGVSQGCGKGSTIAPLPLHFAAHAAL